MGRGWHRTKGHPGLGHHAVKQNTAASGLLVVLVPYSTKMASEQEAKISSIRGAASKTTRARRPSPGSRRTHDYSLNTAGVSLPLADPPSLPNGIPVCTPTHLEGIARTQ